MPIVFLIMGSCDRVVKLSAAQPKVRSYHTKGHDHESQYDISTCWFQDAGPRAIIYVGKTCFTIELK